MTALPQYIVAKYVPNLGRMEPRNIGIIVWANGRLASKFLDSDEASFVRSRSVFRRWVRFWEGQTKEATIRVGGRKPVACDDPRVVDELCRTQKGQYLLYKAGRIHDTVTLSDLEDVASFLFDELVSTKKSPKAMSRADQFSAACSALLEEAGLTQRADWQGERIVEFDVRGIRQEYVFDYVVGNGAPLAVGQRVPLGKPVNVNSAAFLFEWIAQSNVVRNKKNLLALVDAEASVMAEPRMRLLDTFATVINVADKSVALKSLEEVEVP